MTAPLPFGRFLEDLRRRDLAIGVREAELFYRLLARWQGHHVEELRDSIAALLARDRAEVALIRRVFDETLSAEREPPAPPPARRGGARRRLIAATVVSLVALALVVTATITRSRRSGSHDVP